MIIVRVPAARRGEGFGINENGQILIIDNEIGSREAGSVHALDEAFAGDDFCQFGEQRNN